MHLEKYVTYEGYHFFMQMFMITMYGLLLRLVIGIGMYTHPYLGTGAPSQIRTADTVIMALETRFELASLY